MSVHAPVETSPEPSHEQQPPRSHKEAKAAAKAAKAYAKAQRPWYKKKRYILSLAGILLIAIIAATSGGTGSDKTTGADRSANPAPTTSQPANKPGGPTAKMPIQNGDWRLDSIRVKDDGLGDFGGTARVTYTGSNPEGGTNLFTVTVFVNGKDVAVLNGSADAVQSGRAATVQFISQDKFVGGPYKFDFQNDL